MDPITLLAAFVPVVIDGLKQGINYFTGGPKPTSVQDVVSLRELDIRQLEAIAKLDTAENVSRWVSNFRAIQRPMATAIILVYFGFSLYYPIPTEVRDTLSFLVQCAFFYLFGEKTLAYSKTRGK